MSTTDPARRSQGDTTFSRALDRLRKPGTELVLTCTPDTVSGRSFYIMPDGVRVADATAQELLEHPRIQPYSDGLFPGVRKAGGSATGGNGRGDHHGRA